MNYRELVLGMAGVHSHLLQHGRPVYGYEQHFIPKTQSSLLSIHKLSEYTVWSVCDRQGVVGRVLRLPIILQWRCTGVFLWHLSDLGTFTHGSGGKTSGKPWSGYPYPYCYFFNECNSCVKKSCGLKHECGYCHTPDPCSKECSKSLWKKPTSGDTATFLRGYYKEGQNKDQTNYWLQPARG